MKEIIKAVNSKGCETFFSETDWKSGLPQRYGWVEKGADSLRTLPKEIVEFIAPKKNEEKIRETKAKKNDNSKQKVGTPGKRKPAAMGKND